LRERLVAWLSFQRSTLLSSHELGTKQVLELESRLTQVQGQFKERLRNQEERIAELQQEIQGKEKIIRDLLRTQVRLANRAEDEKPDILLG
jgi:TolA-binding protein